MAAVEPADLLDLVLVLPAAAADRVLDTAAQDLQSVLARHVGESIRDRVIWLRGMFSMWKDGTFCQIMPLFWFSVAVSSVLFS